MIQSKAETRYLITSMLQVEAVMKMLRPGYDVRPIAVGRRVHNRIPQRWLTP